MLSINKLFSLNKWSYPSEYIYRLGFQYPKLRITTSSNRKEPLVDTIYKIGPGIKAKFFSKCNFGELFCRIQSYNTKKSILQYVIENNTATGYLLRNKKKIAFIKMRNKTNKPYINIFSTEKKWHIIVKPKFPKKIDSPILICEKKYGTLGYIYSHYKIRCIKDIIGAFTGIGPIYLGAFTNKIDLIKKDITNDNIFAGIMMAIILIELIVKKRYVIDKTPD